MSDATLARIMARWGLRRADVLCVALFGYGHPEQSPSQLVAQFVRGEGPAAVARGVAGVRRVPTPATPMPWHTPTPMRAPPWAA